MIHILNASVTIQMAVEILKNRWWSLDTYICGTIVSFMYRTLFKQVVSSTENSKPKVSSIIWSRFKQYSNKTVGNTQFKAILPPSLFSVTSDQWETVSWTTNERSDLASKIIIKIRKIILYIFFCYSLFHTNAQTHVYTGSIGKTFCRM